MKKAQQETPEHPAIPLLPIRLLRLKLIKEEYDELADALINKQDLVQSYDAILDLLVVVIGTAVAMGMEIEPGWQEVHRSNMSKFIDGYRREDGKWMKGKSYSPANLKPILDAQKS